MQSSKAALLSGVKTAVARYGIAEFSVRRLTEISGVSVALFYHYFNGKEDALCLAYSRENAALFASLLHYLERIDALSVDFSAKARLWFHKAWRELLSDPERVVFCAAYYHTASYENTQALYTRQAKQLTERVGKYFKTDDGCTQTLYLLLPLLFDSAKRVIYGSAEDTLETENAVYAMLYGMISPQINA